MGMPNGLFPPIANSSLLATRHSLFATSPSAAASAAAKAARRTAAEPGAAPRRRRRGRRRARHRIAERRGERGSAESSEGPAGIPARRTRRLLWGDTRARGLLLEFAAPFVLRIQRDVVGQ